MTESVSTAIVIGKRRIPYRLVRSPSACQIKLSMTMDEFRVTAPEQTAMEEIRQALGSRHRWIIESYAALQEKYEHSHKIARFRTGAKLPYWGRLARLRTQLADLQSPAVSYRHGFYVEHPNYATSAEHDEAVETALHLHLRQRFTEEARVVVRRYSESLGVQPRALRVVAMNRRWGSCSRSGCVSLDWRLVYAPKRVVGYVVAHELTHLKVSNHSRAFWNLLSAVHGDYHPEHQWLEQNEHLLGYRKLVVDINGGQSDKTN